MPHLQEAHFKYKGTKRFNIKDKERQIMLTLVKRKQEWYINIRPSRPQYKEYYQGSL